MQLTNLSKTTPKLAKMNALNLLSCTMLVAALLLVVSGVAAERITSDYVTERDQGTVVSDFV